MRLSAHARIWCRCHAFASSTALYVRVGAGIHPFTGARPHLPVVRCLVCCSPAPAELTGGAAVVPEESPSLSPLPGENAATAAASPSPLPLEAVPVNETAAPTANETVAIPLIIITPPAPLNETLPMAAPEPVVSAINETLPIFNETLSIANDTLPVANETLPAQGLNETLPANITLPPSGTTLPARPVPEVVRNGSEIIAAAGANATIVAVSRGVRMYTGWVSVDGSFRTAGRVGCCTLLLA